MLRATTMRGGRSDGAFESLTAVGAIRLSGDLSGEAWLREWLVKARDVTALGPLLLVPSALPPDGRRLGGRIVCNCFEVAEGEIASQLTALPGSSQAALIALQTNLKCGTNCGSCLPELKRLALGSRR